MNPYGLAFDSAGRLYVTNAGARPVFAGPYTITVYAPGATGDATPIATIAGTNTGLNNPQGLAFDDAGRLYVANYGASSYGGTAPSHDPGSITVYAPGATGDATPIATIAGPNTGLDNPLSLAIR